MRSAAAEIGDDVEEKSTVEHKRKEAIHP
jgi:hypothetical protein